MFVERQLECAGDGEIQFAERLGLVNHERDRIRSDRHVTRHTGDPGVGRHTVRSDRVVLHLVASIGTKPIGRGCTQSETHDRDEGTRDRAKPNNRPPAAQRISERIN